MQLQNKGLTSKQAHQILQKHGENKLTEKNSGSLAAMFFSQFKDLMIIILAIATVISVAMGQGAEAISIIVIVLLNASMGFVQEYKTEKTLKALKQLSSPMARVIRDGVQTKIKAELLVNGDVILLKAGDKIPADAKIIDAVNVSCNESMLTGESHATIKNTNDNIYMGCIIATGKAQAIVTHTGMNTQMGKIAHLMQTTQEEPTPLQIKLKQLGKFVAFLCVSVCLTVGVIGYIQSGELLNMLLTGVSLAVAAIPEGLPAIVTITLALSVNRILKKGAIIRKLHAVETLGCASVICTDKTGTITQNKMAVQKLVTATNSKSSIKNLLKTTVLCCSENLNETKPDLSGDATEIAILIEAKKQGIHKNTQLETWSIIKEEPFDSSKKRMSVTVQNNKTQKLICKGAPEIILKLCSHFMCEDKPEIMSEKMRVRILADIKAMSMCALRVIATAENLNVQNGEKDMCFCGLIGMIDPPRPEVLSAVRKCKSAGIKPVMITGDSKLTALAIAKSVEIAQRGDTAIEGEQIDKMSDEELKSICMKTSVFARVLPQHKLRIVRMYKKCGEVTAMTGDGVNDAPAVKEADIGIAMGITGTDVTKEASGVVISDDNFATIIAAVEEGRVIYQNIKRFIRFLLTSNLGEVLGMLFAILLGLPAMLAPIQILLVNLFTDGLPAIALGLEPADEHIMKNKPRNKKEGLFANGLGLTIIIRGTMLAIAACIAYISVLNMGATLEIARSASFITIVISQMLHIFECRGKNKMVFGGNNYLLAAIACSVICTVLSVYVPSFQPIFGTQAVLGLHLIPVIICSSAGFAITTLWRVLFND